jgi:hypothetical protein
MRIKAVRGLWSHRGHIWRKLGRLWVNMTPFFSQWAVVSNIISVFCHLWLFAIQNEITMKFNCPDFGPIRWIENAKIRLSRCDRISHRSHRRPVDVIQGSAWFRNLPFAECGLSSYRIYSNLSTVLKLFWSPKNWTSDFDLDSKNLQYFLVISEMKPSTTFLLMTGIEIMHNIALTVVELIRRVRLS